MKVKYIGHGKKISIRLPIGAPKKKQTHVVTWEGQETKEVPDVEAIKLLETDGRNFKAVEFLGESFESEVIEETKEVEEAEQPKRRGRPKKSFN